MCVPEHVYEPLEEEITRELLEEYGDDGTWTIDLFGGPGFVQRIVTSN